MASTVAIDGGPVRFRVWHDPSRGPATNPRALSEQAGIGAPVQDFEPYV